MLRKARLMSFRTDELLGCVGPGFSRIQKLSFVFCDGVVVRRSKQSSHPSLERSLIWESELGDNVKIDVTTFRDDGVLTLDVLASVK